MYRRIGARLVPLAWAALMATGAGAQAPAPLTLRQAFEAAWERQPEAAAQNLRRDAADAARAAARSWTAEPAALELRSKTDRLNGNGGAREYEAGIAIPLWLPGERERVGQLAAAESSANETRLGAAKLRTAAQVRDAWWAWHRAALEHELARDRLASAQQLAGDVAKRVRAGDLARSDQFQADGAIAQAEAALAESVASLSAARLAVRSVTGTSAAELGGSDTEAAPTVPAELTDASHPALAELLARVEVSRKAADLAAVRRRANPELTIATTRERGQFGEPAQGSLTVGIRIPFGGGSRTDAMLANARADALEAEGQAALERSRLLAEVDAARSRVDATRVQLDAAEKRARLAREVRGFFEKSFRLGESDLPTRLRVELEAVEAERQAARTRIEAAAAISSLRQALGLLPQ